MTGRCGACHRARIRATRWHRRENAARRPGHERICSRRRDLPVGPFVETAVESALQKYFHFHSPQITSRTSRIPPHQRGVSRSSRTRGADAVDAAAFCAQRDCRAGDEPVSDQQHADERCCCVRRSRVVLTPRRWRQVCGRQVSPTGRGQATYSASDGGKRARSPGRARRKPLKPLRAGMPGDSGVLVVTRVLSTNTKCTRGCGCSGHPAFPTPSVGGSFKQRLGRLASRGRSRIRRDSVIASVAKQYIFLSLRGEMDCFAELSSGGASRRPVGSQ